MGSNARIAGLSLRSGKAAAIGGAAAALLGTGTATAANITPTHVAAVSVRQHNAESRRNSYKPRTASGRDPVRYGPGRTAVAGRLVPDELRAASLTQAIAAGLSR